MHLAALSNDPLGDLSPELTYEINHRGDGLARARREGRGCRALRLRVVVLDVRRRRRGRVARRRRSAPPADAVCGVEGRSEEALVDLDGDGFTTVSMRNATVYGVSSRLRLDIVLNNLAAWASCHGSDPAAQRRHVVAAAPARARSGQGRRAHARRARELVGGRAFNIGSDAQNYLVRDLAEILAEVTGCDVEFAGDASPDPRSYRVDFSRLAAPSRTSRSIGTHGAGAEELVDAYRRVGLSEEAFEGRSYVRLRQLRYLLDKLGSGRTSAGRSADVRFVETTLPGVVVVELEEHVDERGSFARTWCREEMTAAGLASDLAQCSMSRNPRAGTLTGPPLPACSA